MDVAASGRAEKSGTTREVPPFPGPGPEPWWWAKTSPFWHDTILGLHRKKERRAQEENAAHEEVRCLYPLYLRFGEPPPGGRSACIARAPALEAGISVFRARRVSGGYETLAPGPAFAPALAFGMFRWAKSRGRSPFLLEGVELLGVRGEGGEPLLKDLKSVERIPDDVNIRHVTQGTSIIDGVLPFASEATRASRIHGPVHWRRVAATGLKLCKQTPGADKHVVSLFAAFHDSKRLSDGRDPEHGKRGAALARELRGSLYGATDEQMALLEKACAEHTRGEVTTDPTLGVCWDADRLDLPRVGKSPDPTMLSTNTARQLATDERGV